jgi:hypothetical protein
MFQTNEIDLEGAEDVREFSVSMRCHERTTRRWIASGELEAVYVAGKYLIACAAKARFLRGRLGARRMGTRERRPAA